MRGAESGAGMAATAATLNARLQAGRCRVLALDVLSATGMRLHAAYTPCEWEHNQFAADALLQRHVADGHPWLVKEPHAADVVVLVGHGFDRWCVAQTLLRNRILEAQTSYTNSELHGGALCANRSDAIEACGAPHANACKKAGRLFRSEVAKRALWERMHAAVDALNTSAPRVVVLLNNECPPAWLGSKRGMKDTLMLADRVSRPSDGTVPFVLSRPAWLLGDAPVPADLAPTAPWASRKLMLFAGHVPKLYISRTRYHLWRAWRREPRVSIYTKDIACALSAHSICRQPERWPAEHLTFCQRDCGTTRACKGSVGSMQRECKFYQKVDWDEELPDVARTNRGLSRSDYLRAAMSHRFCVIAPGDYPSTPKITEFVAVGAAGGCIPVVVVPSPVDDSARRQLPYSSTWLDYCDIAYLIPESAVSNASAMTEVLERLDAVSAAEAARRRRALRRVRDAFVTRATPAAAVSPRPTASDFLLHEACQLAARHRTQPASSERISQRWMRGGRLASLAAKRAAARGAPSRSLARCLLATERQTRGAAHGRA